MVSLYRCRYQYGQHEGFVLGFAIGVVFWLLLHATFQVFTGSPIQSFATQSSPIDAAGDTIKRSRHCGLCSVECETSMFATPAGVKAQHWKKCTKHKTVCAFPTRHPFRQNSLHSFLVIHAFDESANVKAITAKLCYALTACVGPGTGVPCISESVLAQVYDPDILFHRTRLTYWLCYFVPFSLPCRLWAKCSTQVT